VPRLEFRGNRSKSIKSSEQKTSREKAALGNKRKLKIADQQPIDFYSSLSHKDLSIQEIDQTALVKRRKVNIAVFSMRQFSIRIRLYGKSLACERYRFLSTCTLPSLKRFKRLFPRNLPRSLPNCHDGKACWTRAVRKQNMRDIEELRFPRVENRVPLVRYLSTVCSRAAASRRRAITLMLRLRIIPSIPTSIHIARVPAGEIFQRFEVAIDVLPELPECTSAYFYRQHIESMLSKHLARSKSRPGWCARLRSST